MGKRIMGLLLGLLFLFFSILEVRAQEEKIAIQSPSAYLMEMETGTVLYEKNKEEERSPASVTKIMTLLLTFEELEKGTLKMEDEVITSATAKSMGGSQVFLEEGEKQTVETLIKCIVIASGNDASVAMAEHIAGSEQSFVEKMNAKAKELGMEHTHFVDCCGLTDSDDHYTTVEDIGIMSRELINRFPVILEYSSIWMENITHVTKKGSEVFGLTNTNKMLRTYEGCVGLKTGSTSKAKFCVSSVAKRNGITLIAVVMGADTSKIRFQDVASMFQYGFGVCSLYKDEKEEHLSPVHVQKGVKEEVDCAYEKNFVYVDTKGQNLDTVEKEIQYQELQAPVKAGDVVGSIIYYLQGEKIGSVNIISKEDVKKAGFWDYLKKAGNQILYMENE